MYLLKQDESRFSTDRVLLLLFRSTSYILVLFSVLGCNPCRHDTLVSYVLARYIAKVTPIRRPAVLVLAQILARPEVLYSWGKVAVRAPEDHYDAALAFGLILNEEWEVMAGCDAKAKRTNRLVEHYGLAHGLYVVLGHPMASWPHQQHAIVGERYRKGRTRLVVEISQAKHARGAQRK